MIQLNDSLSPSKLEVVQIYQTCESFDLLYSVQSQPRCKKVNH